MITDEQGFGWLSEDDFIHHFAADLEPPTARAMWAAQQPLAVSSFGDVIGAPAWKSQRSWYLIATQDEAIPPDAQRRFAARMGATTVEIAASHVAMVSRPAEVTEFVKSALQAVGPRERSPAGDRLPT
jgi:pimeloyl-ACP methyl ester carboxylesterase